MNALKRRVHVLDVHREPLFGVNGQRREDGRWSLSRMGESKDKPITGWTRYCATVCEEIQVLEEAVDASRQ